MHSATCMCYTTDPTLPVHSTRSIAFNYYGSGTIAPATAPYLYSHHFTLQADHKPLMTLYNEDKPICSVHTGINAVFHFTKLDLFMLQRDDLYTGSVHTGINAVFLTLTACTCVLPHMHFVDLPQDSTFSAALGVGVAIGFTTALILAILGCIIVWLLRKKCRNESGKYTRTSINLYYYAYTTIQCNGFPVGQKQQHSRYTSCPLRKSATLPL